MPPQICTFIWVINAPEVYAKLAQQAKYQQLSCKVKYALENSRIYTV